MLALTSSKEKYVHYVHCSHKGKDIDLAMGIEVLIWMYETAESKLLFSVAYYTCEFNDSERTEKL